MFTEILKLAIALEERRISFVIKNRFDGYVIVVPEIDVCASEFTGAVGSGKNAIEVMSKENRMVVSAPVAVAFIEQKIAVGKS